MALDTKTTGKPVQPSVQTTEIAICGPLTPISRLSAASPALEEILHNLNAMVGARISSNEESPGQPSVIA